MIKVFVSTCTCRHNDTMIACLKLHVGKLRQLHEARLHKKTTVLVE